jgi:NADH:ubiquinone oxidoreductase subunit D
MARSTGIKRDLRLDRMETYANYYHLNFRSYIGQKGDSYDRFLIRMNEMTESLNIINQVINKLTKFKKNEKDGKKNSNINPHHILKYLSPKEFNNHNYKSEYTSMEQLINHFKYWSEGFPVESG